MRNIIIAVCLVLFIYSGLCSGSEYEYGDINRRAEDVSLIQLIANPNQYHGKYVRVTGVANLEFEGNSIWLTKEHLQYRIYKNSLWIEPNYDSLNATTAELKKFNGQYVLIEGTFNKNNTGHLGGWSGSIMNVTRYESWEYIVERIESLMKKRDEAQ